MVSPIQNGLLLVSMLGKFKLLEEPFLKLKNLTLSLFHQPFQNARTYLIQYLRTLAGEKRKM